jgi:prepilin-type N-terminal cleavage/methylation domain-containing protein
MTRHGPTDHPRGFTLVELLVALSIVGLLIGLLLPAVARAREAARRADCLNRLHQLGVALQSFQSANGVYPCPMPPRTFHDGREWSADREFSGYYEMLPFLEQTPLYNAFNLGSKDGIGSPTFTPEMGVNQTAFRTRVQAFLCPSDPLPGRAPPSPVNYRFNVGGSSPLWIRLADTSVGAFDPIRPAGPNRYLDGLSTTAALSERVVGGFDPTHFDRRRDLWAANIPGWVDPDDGDEVLRVCRSLTRTSVDFWHNMGESWSLGGNFYLWYNHVAPPNDRGADCDTNDGHTGEASRCANCSMAARSFHDGGVHVLAMDGTVRFVTDGIDLRLWRALGTRAGSEPAEWP